MTTYKTLILPVPDIPHTQWYMLQCEFTDFSSIYSSELAHNCIDIFTQTCFLIVIGVLLGTLYADVISIIRKVNINSVFLCTNIMASFTPIFSGVWKPI